MILFSRRTFSSGVIAVSASVAAGRTGGAQDRYPARQIKAIAFSGPGGSGDVMQRLVTDNLSKALSQSVILDYRIGANGIIAATATAKAEPDGYTLLIANVGPMAINKVLYSKLPYDPESDFEPVTLAVSSPIVLLMSPSVPVNTVQELVAFAKRDPKAVTFGYPGPTGMLLGAGFMQKAGLNLLQVPYRTVPATMTDLIAGRIQLFFAGASNAIPQIEDGKVKALAITTKKRSPLLPSVPTLAELELAAFDSDFWTGFFVPAKTPREIVIRLNAEIVKILHAPELRDRLVANGDLIVASTPEALRDQIAIDVAGYGEIMRQGNLPQINL